MDATQLASELQAVEIRVDRDKCVCVYVHRFVVLNIYQLISINQY